MFDDIYSRIIIIIFAFHSSGVKYIKVYFQINIQILRVYLINRIYILLAAEKLRYSFKLWQYILRLASRCVPYCSLLYLM